MALKSDKDWLNFETCSEEDIDNILSQIYVFRASQKRDTRSQVETFLKHQSHLDRVSRDYIAKLLNMSARTLSRRLEKQNTSFQQLLNNERKRRCCHYLQIKIDNGVEVARMLGFSDPAYFYQSFKQWTQISFTEAKKKLAENPSDIGNIFNVQPRDPYL